LLDQGGRALNPPSTLSGEDDPGSMAVNYRSAPLTFRGSDPSQWFSSSVRSQPNFAGIPGDPDTPVIQTYPGERLRIRIVQGSHEEQHGFALHGMRWRRDWGHPRSSLVNQQTLGISEAFTLDINPADASPYGVGDHLWHFCSADDLWLGCWGLVRSLAPTPANFDRFSPLPDLLRSPAEARKALREARAVPKLPPKDAKNIRSFVVVAQRTEHLYSGTALTDPWGLIYRTVKYGGSEEITAALETAIEQDYWELEDDRVEQTDLPLVLRARRGEWVRVILINDLLDDDDRDDDGQIEFGVEPSPARLPLEHLDDLFRPDRRTVSTRVSLHASLLSYDVAKFDGSNVGLNFDSTVAPWRSFSEHTGSHLGGAEIPGAVVHRSEHYGRRNWREYWWYADEHLAPERASSGAGQVCYLYDMGDIRNHRHHGLIGALIVEPGDASAFAPGSIATQSDGWTGINAEIRVEGRIVARETVVFVQDGLRFFVNGNPDFPMPDVNPGDDPEDSGQKAINYRSHPIHQGVVSKTPTPVFPLLKAKAGDKIWLRVIGAGDKPRQHTITVHGCAWLQAKWVPNGAWTSSVTGLSPCRAETIELILPHKGDYAVRAGAFRWAAEQGIWSSLQAES
jgi:manganese oxidase